MNMTDSPPGAAHLQQLAGLQVATANQPAPDSVPAPPVRLLDLSQCLDRIGVGKTWFFAEVKAGRAPTPVRLGRSSRWVEAEIQQFITDRINAYRAGR